MIARSLKSLWRSLSIKNKQLIFFTGLLTLISMISLYSVSIVYRYVDEFQDTLASYHTINKYLLGMKSIRAVMGRQMKDGTADGLLDFLSLREELIGLLARVDRESNVSLSTYFLIRALQNGQGVYFEKCLAAIDGKQQGQDSYYIPFYTAERIADYMESYLSQLLNIRLAEENRYFRRLGERVSFARLLTIVGLVFIWLLCFAFAILFSNSLTKAIRKLAAASIRMSNGDLEAPPITVESKDEIGILARSFNVMSGGIKSMVEDLKEKAVLEKKLHEEELANVSMQKSLKEAQFLSLQAQINPHFLFNTLNTIARKASLERADDTAALIRSLSDLFRYNLHGFGRSVKLREELDVVKEYLRIQKFRFGDRIRTDIRCSVDPDAVDIPSFTLQPLVENSILHGIEPKEGGGRLRIKITEHRGRIRIRITDTGIGMAKERIEEILSPNDDLFQRNGKRIGVRNVVTRLRLFFNGEEEFLLRSKAGRGAFICISFPRQGGHAGVQPAHSG